MANVYRIVRNCRANDRRGSVFALAALERHPPVAIDYRLSVSEVYQQATLALIRQHRSLQVLRRLASPSRASDLPSWTLDFNAPLQAAPPLWAIPGPRFRIQGQGTNIEESDATRLGLWPPGTRVPHPHLDPDRSDTLLLAGIHMETIAATGPVMPIEVAAAAATIANSSSSSSSSASSSPPTTTNHNHHDQFISILRAGRPSPSPPPPPTSVHATTTSLTPSSTATASHDPLARPTEQGKQPWLT